MSKKPLTMDTKPIWICIEQEIYLENGQHLLGKDFICTQNVLDQILMLK